MQVPQIEFVDAVLQINGGRHCLLRRLRVRQPVEKRVDRRRAANLRSHWYRWMAGLSSASAPPQRLINNPPSGSLSVGNLRGGRVTVLGVTEETILPGTTKGP